MNSSKYGKLVCQAKDVALTAAGGNPEEAPYRDDAHAAYANALK